MDRAENNAELIADIVSAYVSHNSLPPSELAGLIAAVHASVQKVVSGQSQPEHIAQPIEPKVSIKKSVHKDHLVCLEDGLKFKTLKRHLSSHHDMTPHQYRTKWKLPADYPMVSPAYSEKRSKLARAVGLGSSRSSNKTKTSKTK